MTEKETGQTTLAHRCDVVKVTWREIEQVAGPQRQRHTALHYACNFLIGGMVAQIHLDVGAVVKEKR
jgi:hypothetical protein